MKRIILIFLASLMFQCCTTSVQTDTQKESKTDYLNYTNSEDRLAGGVKMIPIQTPAGKFKVWTKRVGNNPTMKVLLLHGGPGATHEYFECFDAFLPKAGIEYYYYDQLESAYSDQPSDSILWDLDRFVDEVEQVRLALGLTKDNFYLFGHSWGGILGIEYALKYQDNIKGLIIANMVSSIPSYMKYANEVLGPKLDPEVLAEIRALEADEDYANPRYNELIYTHYYPKHVLRMPLDEWPDPVNRAFAKLNVEMYTAMQGPSEFGVVGDAKLKSWDRSQDLSKITIPTLTIGGAYDTMDPKHMEWMAGQMSQGTYLHCPNGSHMDMYDDQETFFEGLIRFIREVDQGNKK